MDARFQILPDIVDYPEYIPTGSTFTAVVVRANFDVITVKLFRLDDTYTGT
jgi:hypothetical protein